MRVFRWGMGGIATISTLAVKVYTAYKNAPENYRHISEEVESLQILINKAIQLIKGTTLRDNDRQEGQKVLKGCYGVLKDLNSLVKKHKSLASTNKSLATQKVKLGTDDITTLRSRLISNTALLNTFIQRFDIPTFIKQTSC